MDSSMSPLERHESRRKLMELFNTSWCCVKTRQTFWSTQRSINTCRNVTVMTHKTGWKYHSEAVSWLRQNGFPTTSNLDEDQSSEWLYEAEREGSARGQDIPEWMSDSLPDVDPVGLENLSFTVYTEDGKVRCLIEDTSPPLPESETTNFPEVVPDNKTEIVGAMWKPIVSLLDQFRNKPKHYDAWLSDCALSLMEADYEDLKSLFYCLRDNRKLSPIWLHEFRRRAMKRRVNYRDVGECSGDVRKSIKCQVYETEEFWYKVPSSDQDPSTIAAENETPPLERRDKFLRLMTRLCFLDDIETVTRRINERSTNSKSGFTRYRQDNLYKFIMLKSLFLWPTATTTERQRLMAQSMRKHNLYKSNQTATSFPLDVASYVRVKNQIETQITLSTLIWSSPEAMDVLKS